MAVIRGRRAFLGLAGMVFLLGALAAAWMAPVAAQSEAAPLRVVTTTAMIADGVRAIGGERLASVDSLLGEGVDPHLYKPTRADVARMLRADLIIGNGLQLEAQFQDTFDQLVRSGRSLVFAAERLPKDRLLADAAYQNKPDPHVWMDPDLWIEVMAQVRDALVAKDPAGQASYTRGYENYAERIRGLSAYAKSVLSGIPPERRVLITAHDAFGYFARAYGFGVIGIQGVSTESEAGLRRIEEVVELAVARKIPAIFVEASVSDRNVKAVVEGSTRRGHDLRIAAQIYSDSMGTPGTYEGTYLGMIDHNATTIARALGGEAPERGLNSRLGTGS
ncbi:metal ABC transporter solute-binding protein, Zn/Mn family [Microvirga massiliensis]|uniref:metal ABC transporter solute-binding protein, Zn/Mn family n=1 Tax=Microvirga massiliensis TaxID=1033741 RepID=UPI00069A72A8|nr:zinc ABC transporter substrate-binding protein [Microvirga massiliensis]